MGATSKKKLTLTLAGRDQRLETLGLWALAARTLPGLATVEKELSQPTVPRSSDQKGGNPYFFFLFSKSMAVIQERWKLYLQTR